MDSTDARDTIDQLRLFARAKPQWKPALHRAARMIERMIPADETVAPGRYGGRKLPRAFPKPLIVTSDDQLLQPSLLPRS